VNLGSRLILDANESFAALAGCAPEELRSRRIDEGRPLESLATLLDTVSAEGRTEARAEDLALDAGSGEARRFECVLGVRETGGRRLAHANVRDATRRLLAEEERRNARELLERRVSERTAELCATYDRLAEDDADILTITRLALESLSGYALMA
jgi:PAS domain S-box-containing protein